MGDYTNLSIQLDLDLRPALRDCPVGPADRSASDPASSARTCCGDDPNNCRRSACIDKLRPGQGRHVCTPRHASTRSAGTCPKQFPDICRPAADQVPSLSKLDKCLASGKPLGPGLRQGEPAAQAPRCTRRQTAKGYYSDTCWYRARTGRTTAAGQAPVGVQRGGATAAAPCRSAAAASGEPASAPTRPPARLRRPRRDSDLGALLVWGMMQR